MAFKVFALLAAAAAVAHAGVLARDGAGGWGEWQSTCTPTTIYSTSTAYSTVTVPTTVVSTVTSSIYKTVTQPITVTAPPITQTATITAPPVTTTATVTYTQPCSTSKGWNDWHGSK